MSEYPSHTDPVLVTGATGYVGGRLVPLLLESGYKVRACARSLAKLQARPWSKHQSIELVQADALDKRSLDKAASGCRQAYYLVHSMNPGNKDFAKMDKQAAANMVHTAQAAGLERLIFLGGLGEESPSLSRHLRSRAEVATILQQGFNKTLVLRAAMIIGSGSASFEILRYLVDRLPIMITPKWVETPSQPIAIRDVLYYLMGALELECAGTETFDIGGPEILTYRKLMEIYAQEAKLPSRLILGVPFFTPRLSSYWIHLVTPVPAYIARPLAEGLRNPVVCRDDRIKQLLPRQLLTPRSAIRLALDRIAEQQVISSWTDAGSLPHFELATPYDPGWAGGTVFSDCREVIVNTDADALWQPIAKIGGKSGWYFGNWLWNLRGFMDKLAGGPGLRGGRRSDSEIAIGDAIDFWRVVRLENGRRLLLLAEMKLPGSALLEFELSEAGNNLTRLKQTARFLPSGLLGLLYWFCIFPFHEIVFNGMLRGIAKASRGIIVEGPRKSRKWL